MTTREVPCPRCHEPCGWCSDYRHMHGQLRLPGSKRRCNVPGYEPEGDACPVCHGSMRVLQTVAYTSLPKVTEVAASLGDGDPCVHCGEPLEVGPWGFIDCPACNPNPARE